jgi:hypothetical protein
MDIIAYETDPNAWWRDVGALRYPSFLILRLTFLLWRRLQKLRETSAVVGGW